MESKSKKILIVEDDEFTSEDMQDAVTTMGYEVLTSVKSGEEAVYSAEKEMPDLILMDISLHGKLNGFETADEICKKSNLPVIFVTGLSYDDKQHRNKLRVPYGYLEKPFTKIELQNAIESAFTNWSLISSNDQPFGKTMTS